MPYSSLSSPISAYRSVFLIPCSQYSTSCRCAYPSALAILCTCPSVCSGTNRIAFFGHTFTHTGSPPHRSHLKGISMSEWTKIAPYGQDMTHDWQETHFSSSIATTPSSTVIAPVEQLSLHAGSLHCLHTIGIRTTGCGYSDMTRMLAFFGLFEPNLWMAHDSSHNRHPEHLSGTTSVVSWSSLVSPVVSSPVKLRL